MSQFPEYDYLKNAQELHEHQVAELKHSMEMRERAQKSANHAQARYELHLVLVEDAQSRWAECSERTAAAMERIADTIALAIGGES